MKSQLIALMGAMCVELVAQAAHAGDHVNLIVDSSLYVMYTTASGVTYDQFLPDVSEALFLPCDAVNFSGQFVVEQSGFAGDVYLRLVERWYDRHQADIRSTGYSGTNSFNEVMFDSPDALKEGTPVLTPFLAFDATGPDRDWIFQASDLPPSEFVRLNLTVMAFDDPWFKELLPDAQPEDNSLDLWVMRCCH